MEAKLASSDGDCPYLPFHIVEEIFNRLDVQTLFQSSFVCRDWNKLITSPVSCFTARLLVIETKSSLLKHVTAENAQIFGTEAQIFGREYIHFPYCRVTYSVHWDNDQFDLSHKIENNMDDFKDVSILHSCYIYRGKPNVYFNGIIHWIAHNREINCGVILTFDLSREIFGQILLPEDARRHCRLNSVATTGDLLLFTQLSLLQNEYDNEFSDEDRDGS
ncbi:hypothetical protein K1719_008908 [Acacia pycnantha]|nr:hypothetical protein K1719_008908 [Acacia pycnantha]